MEKVFCGSVIRDTNWGRVFWSFRVVRFLRVRVFWERVSGLLGLLGSSRLGFFGEGFSCLLAGEVFLIFSICFVGLALDGGLLGVSFLL